MLKALKAPKKRIDSRNFSVAQPLQEGYLVGTRGFAMFSRRDKLQLVTILSKSGTPDAAVAWDRLLGGEHLAHNPGYPCSLRPSRKLGNPENSA